MARSASSIQRQPRSVWWLWPAAPIVFLVAPTLLAANALSEDIYLRAWRTQKNLDDRWTLVLLVGLAMMALGSTLAWLAERTGPTSVVTRWPSLSSGARTVLHRLYPILIFLSLLGYLVWIANGLRRGLTLGDVTQVLTTQDNFKLPIKEKLETLPGITTLTQVAITATIIGVIIDLDKPTSWVRWMYRLVVLLAAIRAMLLAERLAVAEILVPIIVLRGAAMAHRLKGSRRVALAWAPLFGAVLLIGGFAVSEYTRSWTWYAANRDQSFVEFTAERLLGYYATSHNNGVLILEHTSGTELPVYTTAFLWEIPPGSSFGADATREARDHRGRLLNEFANPEFNSPSGTASPFSDWGIVGGAVFLFVHGFLIGVLHLSFIRGRPVGILLYPIAYIGLLELPRYLYWYQGRATPAILAAVGVAVLIAVDAQRRLNRLALASAVKQAGARV